MILNKRIVRYGFRSPRNKRNKIINDLTRCEYREYNFGARQTNISSIIDSWDDLYIDKPQMKSWKARYKIKNQFRKGMRDRYGREKFGYFG